MIFGYALTLDLRKVPTVVWDQSRTQESRELLSLFDGFPYFSMVGYHDSYEDLQLALDRGIPCGPATLVFVIRLHAIKDCCLTMYS